MKVFISWSGKLSQKIAEELKEWIPQVINDIVPYVTSENIQKGDRWLIEIYHELEDTNFGLVCLTRENLKSPWIMFESGAISKNIKNSKVCCLLFDGLNQSEIEKPLSFFQNAEFTKSDYKKLLFSINESLGAKKLKDGILERSFEKWWPELEMKIKKLTEEYFPNPPIKNKDDIIKEIQRTTNYIANTISRLNPNISKDDFDLSLFQEEVALRFVKTEWIHPVRVLVKPVVDNSGKLKKISITHEGIKIEELSNISTRGVEIELLFQSEENESFWAMYFHFYKGQTYFKVDFVELEDEVAENLNETTIWRD
jgi:hypothetical protein